MNSDTLFVLVVSILTLGGVFVYLLRVEALAKKLESRIRDEELDEPIHTLDDTPAPSTMLGQSPAPRELPR